MTDRLWIRLTLGTAILVAALAIAVGYAIDPYGLFRDPSGRKLCVYFEERKAKFFMSKRYVPANFDSLLLGPSSSDNWDMSSLAGVRIFNESLSGGNASEARILVNQAAQRKHFKLAVLVLAPIMTHNHDVDAQLEDVNPFEAIVSIHAFVHEVDYLRLATHHDLGKVAAAPNGQYQFIFPRHFDGPPMGPDDFAIDPVALKEYRNLVQMFRNQGTTVIYLLPPIYEPYYQAYKSGFDDYARRILAELPPAPVVDFQSPQYTAFRSNTDNFLDWYHLEPVGAAKAVHLLEQAMAESMPVAHRENHENSPGDNLDATSQH